MIKFYLKNKNFMCECSKPRESRCFLETHFQFHQSNIIFLFLQDEYNLNPGLEWEDEFTGRCSWPGHF